MPQPLLSIDALLSRSWLSMKNEWRATLRWTLGSFFAGGVLSLAHSYLADSRPEIGNHPAVLVAYSLLTAFVYIYFSVGLLKHLMAKQEPAISFKPTVNQAYVRLFLAGLLSIILTALGFVALIIPAIWLGNSLAFVTMEVLDGNHTPWNAIKAAVSLVKGRWWSVLGYHLVFAIMLWAVNLAFGFMILAAFAILGALSFGAGSLLEAVSNAHVFSMFQGLIAANHPAIWAAVIIGILLLVAAQAVLSVAQMLLSSSFNILFYRTLKETKEENVNA